MPQTGAIVHRSQVLKGIHGFMNAFLLTGNEKYVEPWQKQIEAINAQKKTINGVECTPTMYGDNGWYAYVPGKYTVNAREVYWMSMKGDHSGIALTDPWFKYLDSRNDDYPEQALRRDLNNVRSRVTAMRRDTTTPDTRLADDPMKYNPASINALTELAMGGLPPGRSGVLLHARLRYFDPVARRAGLPEGVAALIEKMTADRVTLTLVNTNQLDERIIIVQAGGYGEHQFLRESIDGGDTWLKIEGDQLRVRLAPGSGSKIQLVMKRYVNPPTLSFPWDR